MAWKCNKCGFEHRQEHFQKCISCAQPRAINASDVPSLDIYPRIRNSLFTTNLVEYSDLDIPISVKLADGLMVAYGIDDGGFFEYVSKRKMDEIGFKSDDELHQAALDTLNGNKIGIGYVEGKNGIRIVKIGGDLESTSLLNVTFWNDEIKVMGDIAMIPASNTGIFYCKVEESAINTLRLIAGQEYDRAGNHKISNDVYTFSGKWEYNKYLNGK